MALIIFLDLFTIRYAEAAFKQNLQLQLGDSVSIYSEKAYRKNKGLSFEAVGNVVIISGQDTLYGEKASLNVQTGQVKVEGNVRFISQGITIYGSEIDFNSQNNELNMINARIITTDFNIVATEIKKLSNDRYFAKQAEFTTCKDCTESWAIYGNEIYIELNQYVKIHHALTKIKGVSVLYFPFIAIPIKNTRETGLLFPLVTTRLDEGLTYQQPIFWNINDSKDMTITPSFYGRRGYGSDLEYRQVFGDQKWVNLQSRFVNDSIYLPGKTNIDSSETKYFRSFYDFESHYQWKNGLGSHFRVLGMKDLDMISDYNNYFFEYIQESDIGAEAYVEKRSERYELGVEANFKRNLLVDDSEAFDKNYVHVLPSVYFSTVPYNLVHSDKLFLQNISLGMDADVTIFRQLEENETYGLRNIGRLNAKPYIDWQLFTIGPVKAKTSYQLEYQKYEFINSDEQQFTKYAGIMTTEFSFSMDKIFGLSYEQTIPVIEIKKDYLKEIQKASENFANTKNTDLIGNIPNFENSLTQESIKFVKNSYRHSQEFKFLHHLVANSGEYGSDRFRTQINSNTGWLDYDDGIKADIFRLGTFQTRTDVPLNNTLEFQWNNSLIRKSPKKFNFYEDHKFLRDNFSYTKIGYFNLSQGITLDSDTEDDIENRLTRLFINTGYTASKWNINLREYYFHQSADQIMDLGFQRWYDLFSLLGAYNYNSLAGADLRTLRAGFQVRPIDAIGFSILKEQDLDADKNIRSIYQIDFMPENNCWILNFNYRETVVDSRYTFNWVFNFGNDDFVNYKTNFFQFDRINK